MKKLALYNYGIFSLLFLLLFSCKHSGEKETNKNKVTITVTATAYNSLEGQTANDANVTAWGDTLQPGDKVIAVSRNLIEKGLYHNKKVSIKGLPGTYTVKDKMNQRWTNKIDIYMGEDREAAKRWGRKKVQITFDSTAVEKQAIPD